MYAEVERDRESKKEEGWLIERVGERDKGRGVQYV